jgi:fructokinase
MDRIKLLKERFNLETIIVTKGADGAVLNLGDQFYGHKGYSVEVADTIGSGDAFLAAFISKLIDRSPPEEMLEFASATGALIATYAGACPEYHTNEITVLKERKPSEMISADHKPKFTL